MDPEPIATPWTTLADLSTRKVSFAQNWEDIVLERALPGPSGFYIDVGANHPIFHSVTKRFSDRGWSGLNVEPNPRLVPALREARPRDVTLHCGVADVEGTLTFHEVPAIHGWSTFEPNVAAHHRKLGYPTVAHPVPVTTLARLCEEHVGDRVIDFLKVDVEGFELPVIRGADWSRWRPRIVLLEAMWHEAWEHLLLAADYRFALFDGLNRYYVRAEEADSLLPTLAKPANVEDQAVPYDLVRLVQELQSLSPLELAARRLHRRLRRLSDRHPRAASRVKRLLGRRAG